MLLSLRLVVVLGTLTSAARLAAADPKPADTAKADEMIHRYLVAETKKLGEKFMDGAKTKAEWEAKRPRLKQELLEMLGLWPPPEKTDVKATVTGTLDRGDVVIEKLHYQSRPGLYVTGNLYRPKSNDKKLPAVLYVCGHSNKGRDGNKTAYQAHGLWFASNGYICLTLDTLQLGEVAGIHHGTYREGRFWWHSRGYTPAGVECWNGIRGIDYLCSRPDVDPSRIGVTGRSGGGATTVWVAGADDRVKVAVPVSGMSDLESYVSNKVINGHCDCMFFVNTYQWEWTTSFALFAPKPMLFANSDSDAIFPMDGNRRVMARLRQCYAMLGAADAVDEFVTPGGHVDGPELQSAAFRFLNRHLKGEAGEVKPAGLAPVAGKELQVFPEDKDLPKDAINAKVDEVFVAKADVKLSEKPEEFAAWRDDLRGKLGRAIGRITETPSPPFGGTTRGDDYRTENELWVRGHWQGKPDPGGTGVTLVVLNLEDDHQTEIAYWVKRLPDAKAIFAVYPRGCGPHRWIRKNPPNTVERSLALIGETADSGRMNDIRSVINNLNLFSVRVVGRGRAGAIGAYAALYPPMGCLSGGPTRVPEVVIVDPPTSHRDGPHLLNVDRVLDLPTALGLLAPDVTLTLVNAKDKAFDKTAALYKLAGAEGKLKRENKE